MLKKQVAVELMRHLVEEKSNMEHVNQTFFEV